MIRLLANSALSFLTLLILLGAAIVPVAAEGEGGSLTKKAAISCEKAEAIALAKYPGATVEEIEIERDETPMNWEVELRSEGIWKIELEIDAQSGEILKTRKSKARK
ncbi:PepSY domain-containing protein [bacterium]|nr:PepSY domain-containing protein [bacterium]MBP9807950.1 PepSY domain-containing protein [bacterium]